MSVKTPDNQYSAEKKNGWLTSSKIDTDYEGSSIFQGKIGSQDIKTKKYNLHFFKMLCR